MANRLRVTALAVLATLNLVTIGASVAVAMLLPARLALWRLPQVAPVALARSAPVLPASHAAGAVPSSRGLATLLGPLLSAAVLGHHVGAVVTSLPSGALLYARQGSVGFTPASSEKLATAAAALSVLGPDATLTTRVVAGPGPGTVTLVGGGDPSLAAGKPPAADYPQPATLASLAAATARRLRAEGARRVRLGFDVSLFSGPAMGPRWTKSYVTTGNVTPITALEVDQGRLTSAGAPQDADDEGNYRARTFTPTTGAVTAFGSFLRADGVRLDGPPVAAKAPAGAPVLAAVHSPVLSSVVAWMLRESNNVIAEDLARQVALRTGRPATFSGAASAVTAELRRLGVTSGVHLVDGSGLSPEDSMAPAALAAIVTLAVTHPELRSIVAALPVAGFSGTLAPGQSVFGGFSTAALGTLRAKTGNLSRVATLTGIAETPGGRLLGFAFMANDLSPHKLWQAADAIDAAASALTR